MRRSPPTVELILGLLLGLAPLPAAALDVPGINGHMTDPQGKLGSSAKTSVEDRLTKIQEDTHIDVAGWITNAPEDQAEALGAEAFKRWNIGGDWDNGVFFLFPGTGRVHVIQNRAKPELTPEEAKRLAAADNPTDSIERRIERLADEARTLLVPKTQKQVRPWGTAHPERGHVYTAVASVIALFGVGLSLRRKLRPPPPEPPPPAPPPPEPPNPTPPVAEEPVAAPPIPETSNPGGS